MSRISEEVIAL